MMEPASQPRNVALVGYEGAQSLDIVGPLEVFAMANRFAETQPYTVILASPEGGTISCNSGLLLADSVALEDLPADLDTILVAGGSRDALRRASDGRMLDWLNVRAATTRRLGSVCSGALVLAASGVLDGRRATTHWGYCEELRNLRSAVQLEPDAIFVADPPYYTSAGVTAGIDLCLSLVEADCGSQLALAVARNLVLFMRRPGGQTQYSEGLNVQAAATPRLRQLVTDISADPCGDLSVPELASRAAMSERTFSRVFQKETGVSPAAFVEIARVNRAKALLETSDWTLGRVAERAGFGGVEGLHRAFNKRVGVTPGEYRQRFGQVSTEASAAAAR
ncbi:GlxA family transcriptional regulator [Allosphingosinicella sp.]|uniref:GlxA family transcriptional regulator n=1 Tax=Allosphingosinicella sp. TaxID=2823234 RepID=UPI0037834195